MAKAGYNEPPERIEYYMERYHKDFLTTLLVSVILALCFGIIVIVSFDFSKSGVNFGIWFVQGILVMSVLFFSLGSLYKGIFRYGWSEAAYEKK